MRWAGPALLAAIALVLVLKRREQATMQSSVLGGRIVPGCIVAEAISLALLAALMLLRG